MCVCTMYVRVLSSHPPTGALEQLEVELHQVQSHWMGREEEMRALCDSKQREVQHEA